MNPSPQNYTITDAIRSLLLFEQNNTDDNVELVCVKVIELIRQFPKPPTFIELCRKITKYLNSCDSVNYFTNPCRGFDGIFRVNVSLQNSDSFELEYHNHNEYCDEPMCSIFHFTRNKEIILPCNSGMTVTYEEALAIVQHVCENNKDAVTRIIKVAW